MTDTTATESVRLIHGDCLEVMPSLPAQSVQMVFADLPYAISGKKCTKLFWDIPFDVQSFSSLVQQVVTTNAILAMTANLRFASFLIEKVTIPFRYDWVWKKTRISGFLNAKKMPLRAHEHILIFYKNKPTYLPIMRKNISARQGSHKRSVSTGVYGEQTKQTVYVRGAPLHPISVFSVPHPNVERGNHPTQKPIALLEYLICTYTNPGDTVLDPVAGSGTTAIAAMRTGRRAICIEKEKSYFDIMVKRVAEERARMKQATLPT